METARIIPHCVLCGQKMTPETLHGIVCVDCFVLVYGQHRNHAEPLTIQFCHRCGQPLAPAANEIEHTNIYCQ